MSDTDNKAVVGRYYDEVLNQRKVDLIGELAAEDYVEHDPFPGHGNGRSDLKARAGLILGAFNPLVFTVEDVVAEGDRVVVRWSQIGTHSGNFMGIPATGKEFTIAGIDIHAVREGPDGRALARGRPARVDAATWADPRARRRSRLDPVWVGRRDVDRN